MRGQLGRILVGVSAFEVGNVAATLLILRATQLLTPSHGHNTAVKLGLGLYTAYNLAATLASIPGGRLGDRRGTLRVLLLGVACFAAAYIGLALSGATIALLALFFALAGVAIGLVETAEHAAVAALAPLNLRGSAFGALAAIQSLGNFAASAAAGLLWTTISPRAAFLYLAAWMCVSLAAFTAATSSRSSRRARS